MRVLFIFIDGLGLGVNDPAVNPLVKFPGRFFPMLLGEPLTGAAVPRSNKQLLFCPLDASLTVTGLPQSATGQTALFTGVNAAKVMGHHIAAFPGPQLTTIIRQSGIMATLRNRGYQVTSANVYRPDYFMQVAKRKRRHAVTTLLSLTAGVPVRGLTELLNGRAVYQDITNQLLVAAGFDVPLVTPSVAGKRLVELAQEHHFTLFEYFLTDRCGHKQNWIQAEQLLAVLDEFLLSVYCSAPSELLLIISSDHGNFEDLTTKTHTLNSVPGLVVGAHADKFTKKLSTLTDFTPAIVSYIEKVAINE